MQEICQSGSEGGAKHIFVPTPIGDEGAQSASEFVERIQMEVKERQRD